MVPASEKAKNNIVNLVITVVSPFSDNLIFSHFKKKSSVNENVFNTKKMVILN